MSVSGIYASTYESAFTFIRTGVLTFNPSLVTPYGSGESAALGQIALCCAMIYYLFSKQTKKNRNIAILIMLLGLISGKSKYFGECVVFIALVVFVKSKINFTSVSTLLKVALLGSVVIFFTWTKFNAYYVEGFQEEAQAMARPATYETGIKIMFKDYIPFGSGLGSFGTAAAAKEYSPLYYKYQLNTIWGLDPSNPMFLADAFYPTLAEFGIVGLFFFLWFWIRMSEAHKLFCTTLDLFFILDKKGCNLLKFVNLLTLTSERKVVDHP